MARSVPNPSRRSKTPEDTGTVRNITGWRRLRASEIVGELDPNNLKQSITDTGDEITCVASKVQSGQALPDVCYTATWDLLDPDTPWTGAIDWSEGEYLSCQVMATFGTNFPSANREACHIGIGRSTELLATGLYVHNETTNLAASRWSVADINAVTWVNGSNVLYGEQIVAPEAGTTQVLMNFATAYQLDDATTPERVKSSLAGALVQTPATNLRIVVAFSGSIDVTAHYRLVRIPRL